MTTPPPNRIDSVVEECVARSLANGRPLNALGQILDALSLQGTFADSELEAIRIEAMMRIVRSGGWSSEPRERL